LIWKPKNAEFDGEFEYVEKIAKKFTQRKLEGSEFFTQYLTVKKYIIPAFHANNFFVGTYIQLFQLI
jgi:hypothetical protein